jgi:hypothetical protein
MTWGKYSNNGKLEVSLEPEQSTVHGKKLTTKYIRINDKEKVSGP